MRCAHAVLGLTGQVCPVKVLLPYMVLRGAQLALSSLQQTIST